MEEKINKLIEENDKLKNDIFELSMQINYSKEIELLEFVRELYNSINSELVKKDSKYDVDEYNKITKEDILINLKTYIQEFIRNNRLLL